MVAAPIPDNEEARLSTLRAYEILDTPAEREFDDIARLAAYICKAPVSMVSLIDEDRQWFKAKIGVDTDQTPRDVSFCTHTILENEILEVRDSSLDPRFADSPLVTGQPQFRFYAGAPLVAPGGVNLGALCVVDSVPRSLEAVQREMLQALARQVISQLEARRHIARLEELIAERQRTVRQLAVQYATSWVLSLSDTLEEASPLLLREICGALGWQLGALWRVDSNGKSISCTAVWNEPSFPAPRLSAATRNRRVDLRKGLAGRVLATGEPFWVSDLGEDPGLDRAALAVGDGLSGAIAVPVVAHGAVLAVLELFGITGGPRDGDLVDTMVTVGHQIGQFIERAEAQAALRSSEARARAIVDHSLSGIVTYDERGVIETVNPAAERMFGYRREELIGRNLALLLAETVTWRPGETVGLETEWRGRRKDGEIFPFEISVSEFATAEGRRFAGSIRDVSERFEVERLKREFVSTVSHELRTPLTSIRGSLGLLASGVLGDLSEDARELTRIAERNCLHLMALINDILDLDRLQNGILDLHLGRVALDRMVDRAVDAVRVFAEEEGVALESRVETASLWGDEDRLVQVIVNLLSNAVKFSPRGASVTVKAVRSADFVEVSVEDRGRGIPTSYHASIFERFQQVEASDSRAKGGTGLGLSICKAIVSLHQGSIGVKSEEGSGSTFWFRIPNASGEAPNPAPRGLGRVR